MALHRKQATLQFNLLLLLAILVCGSCARSTRSLSSELKYGPGIWIGKKAQSRSFIKRVTALEADNLDSAAPGSPPAQAPVDSVAPSSQPAQAPVDSAAPGSPPAQEALPQDVVVDSCASHVKLSPDGTISISLDQNCGGKFHSTDNFTSGVFTASVQAPSNAAGVSSSFFIGSSDDQAPKERISFAFDGGNPEVLLTSYSVNGDYINNTQVLVMWYDTTAFPHKYTVKWDSHSIVWLVDDTVVRSLINNGSIAFPTQPGSVSASVFENWNGSAGGVNWKNAPFFMTFSSISITSPLVEGVWSPPDTESESINALAPVVVDYCSDHVDVDQSATLYINFDNKCGSRFHSLHRLSSGTFSSVVKCSDGNTTGLVTSLYLSSQEGSPKRDEIDFEWLGNDKNIVQTNYFVNGVELGDHAVLTDLGFDCSEAPHTYTISYTNDQVKWFVDGKVIRSLSKDDQLSKGYTYPSQPVYMYGSIWDASSIAKGTWAGTWNGQGGPYQVQYNNITLQGEVVNFVV